ncbi:hypothetical protein ERO13_A03G038401v2 [Gossypium hirsutum]|nr:hypothetical protein ERO13_A03G038401v2 [Gossypium hirsutum]
MEELGYLWNYQENLDELKLKLQYSSIELESVKMEANEQIRKYKEELKLMVNLLNLAYQERDEARDQLQKLLNKFMPCPPPNLKLLSWLLQKLTQASLSQIVYHMVHPQWTLSLMQSLHQIFPPLKCLLIQLEWGF